jgi:hypothetical protein
VAHVNAATELARPATTPGAPPRPAASLGPAARPAMARRLAGRGVGHPWLPRTAWAVGRTGRPGLLGLALLVASALFLVTTHRAVAAQVQALRDDLAAERRRPRPSLLDEPAEPATTLRSLPARAEVPAMLGQLFDLAARARLTVDTARYEIGAPKGGGVTRHQIAFPVSGPYPQVRAFIDAILEAMPAVAISELALERKSVSDGRVEAQLRMVIYTRSAP